MVRSALYNSLTVLILLPPRNFNQFLHRLAWLGMWICIAIYTPLFLVYFLLGDAFDGWTNLIFFFILVYLTTHILYILSRFEVYEVEAVRLSDRLESKSTWQLLDLAILASPILGYTWMTVELVIRLGLRVCLREAGEFPEPVLGELG